MLHQGSIRQEGSSRYWIDVVAYDVELRARHRRVRIALILVIIALAITAAPNRAALPRLEDAVLARLNPPLNLQGMAPSLVRSRLTAKRRRPLGRMTT